MPECRELARNGHREPNHAGLASRRFCDGKGRLTVHDGLITVGSARCR